MVTSFRATLHDIQTNPSTKNLKAGSEFDLFIKAGQYLKATGQAPGLLKRIQATAREIYCK